jgi:hypothetical protein
MPNDPGQKLVRLIAPAGADECNYGTTRYRVGADGTVVVPEMVAQDLVHGAGFAMAPVQPQDDPADDPLANDPEL